MAVVAFLGGYLAGSLWSLAARRVRARAGGEAPGGEWAEMRAHARRIAVLRRIVEGAR